MNWSITKRLELRAKIYPPNEPTFLLSGCELDLVIVDSRLELLNLVNDKIKTRDYDSDHRAQNFSL